MTSCHGDHTTACLKELPLTFKVLVIDQIPVLWLKFNLNINKTDIFTIQFYFLHFFFVKKCSCHIFNGRIKFYFYPMRLHIDTRAGGQKEKLAVILQMNRTEPLVVTATNSHWWLLSLRPPCQHIIYFCHNNKNDKLSF